MIDKKLSLWSQVRVDLGTSLEKGMEWVFGRLLREGWCYRDVRVIGESKKRCSQ